MNGPRVARVVIVSGLLLLPVAAWAQVMQSGTIAGVVRDETGGVLPGVTVEAASPALIDRVRTVITDSQGLYRIVDLRPGIYTVAFTLQGFGTVIREGVELTTGFTATVNTEMKVGALEETITVSGASPMVDMQSAAKQTVLTREVLDSLPTAHSIQAAAVLIPGLTTSMSGAVGGGRDVGGSTKLQQPGINFRGAATIQLWEGFWLSNVQGTGSGGATSFYVNPVAAQEMSYSTGAASIEVPTAGMAVNMIPKDGGNTFSGAVFADLARGPWHWSNLNDKLRARGITNTAKMLHVSDFNPGFGGRIIRDKLWFYGAFRYEALDITVVDSYYDKNPNPYLYEPDLSRPARDDGYIPNESGRLTWQASPKDKVTFWLTNQNKKRKHYTTAVGKTPDATAEQETPYAQAMVAKWLRTIGNNLLVEGGFANGRTLYIEHYQPHVQPACNMQSCESPTIAITDQANGKSFEANPDGYSEHGGEMRWARASLSYVTGSHALTGGVQLGYGISPDPRRYTRDVTYTFNSGVPQAVVFRIPADRIDSYRDLAIFAQNQWSINRATITGGVRYDQISGYVEDATLPASRWNPKTFFPGFKVHTFKDLSPRVGIAYDLFGNAKTALKANIGRYLSPVSVSRARQANPQLTIGNTDTRTWRDLNGDYTIFNPDDSVQWGELGPTTNRNFGLVIPSTTTDDPATLFGWNARLATVEFQTGVQHQLTPRVSVDGGFYRRYEGNQLATDNTLITGADFDGPFCITAPSSADLPGGGGFPVCGLYDIKPAARGLVQNNRTFARNVGGIVDNTQGFEVNVDARLGGATFVRGGIDANRRALDNCSTFVDSPESRFCQQVTPYRPDFKLYVSHVFPWDLQTSATYQNSQGAEITATWQAPNAVIAPALGRNLATGATARKGIELIQPGTLYGERLNQVDLRVAKRFAFNRYRMSVAANLYNVLNDDYVPVINTNFSTTGSNEFLRPRAVIPGRLFKISGQVDF